MPRFENINAACASISLDTYKRDGFGEQLLAAFLQWRDAQRGGARQEELSAIEAELFPCLEEVIHDLWKITQSLRVSSKQIRDELPTLFRGALRLGDGVDPATALEVHRKQLHIDLVRNHYEEMAGTGTYKFKTHIYKEVNDFLATDPKRFGLPRATTPKTVGNHWEKYLDANPEEKARIELIEELAQLQKLPKRQKAAPSLEKRSSESKPKASKPQSARATKPKNTTKPQSWR